MDKGHLSTWTVAGKGFTLGWAHSAGFTSDVSTAYALRARIFPVVTLARVLCVQLWPHQLPRHMLSPHPVQSGPSTWYAKLIHQTGTISHLSLSDTFLSNQSPNCFQINPDLTLASPLLTLAIS